MKSIEGLTFRPPRQDEAGQVLDLMIRCDIRDVGEADTDLDDLLYEWKGIDLDRDAWLVHTTLGKLVAYGAITPQRSNLRLHLYIDPSQEEDELFMALLERCEQRGLEFARLRGGVEPVALVTYIAHTNQAENRLLLGSGYRVMKYIFNMHADLTVGLQAPAWPAGIAVRSIQPGQDDRLVYDLIQQSFARPGRTPPTFAEWRDFMMRPEIFDPTIWFLAEAGGKLVGACLCFEFTETNLGWVRQLGVLSEWRRRGLGAALLRHAFTEFKRRGFSTAGLAVESDNPNAVSFYLGAGMVQARWIDEYHQDLSSIEDKHSG
jgi:mycothiol synthase